MFENGPQPLQLSEIIAYADYHKIQRETSREDLLAVVSALDRIWLADVYKRRAAAHEKTRRGQEKAAKEAAGRRRR